MGRSVTYIFTSALFLLVPPKDALDKKSNEIDETFCCYWAYKTRFTRTRFSQEAEADRRRWVWQFLTDIR